MFGDSVKSFTKFQPNFSFGPFHANVPFLYPLETTENLLFADIFMFIKKTH